MSAATCTKSAFRSLSSPISNHVVGYPFTLSVQKTRSSPSWFLKCPPHVAQFFCYFMNTFQFCCSPPGGSLPIEGGSARNGWLSWAYTIVKGWKNRYLNILSMLRVTKVRCLVKETAAKVKCINGCQIVAKITTRNTRKLRALSRTDPGRLKAQITNVATIGYSSVLAYPWDINMCVRKGYILALGYERGAIWVKKKNWYVKG